MRKGYLFISNGFKPSQKEAESIEPVAPGSFSRAAIYAANKMDWELHMGVNRNHPEKISGIGYDIKFYNQHTYRNIFAFRDNWIAYKNLCKYLKKNPQIEVIHCNTPIGGVIGRLVGNKFKKKVIYTAHGFHFYKGAPLINRTLFKWIERYLARYTDCLITINQEDFATANKLQLKAGGHNHLVPGVGIETDEYPVKINKDDFLKELGLSNTWKICVSLGNLDKNKNFETLIRAFAILKDQPIALLICGRGSGNHSLNKLIESMGIKDKVRLLGFRTDVKEILTISDIFVLASRREGLPRSTMEAMVAGLPCVVSRIRGNIDLVENGKGGYLVDPMDYNGFAEYILRISQNDELAKKMGDWNRVQVARFDLDTVANMMVDIFKSIDL